MDSCLIQNKKKNNVQLSREDSEVDRQPATADSNVRSRAC